MAALPERARQRPGSRARVRADIARSRSCRSSRSELGSASIAVSAFARLKRAAPTITFSSSVRFSNSPTPWSVRAIPRRVRRCGRIRVIDSPLQLSEPASGATKPQITLNSVVLPAPFGPITPSTSPAWTSSETPSSATTPPNRTVTSRTLRAGPRWSLPLHGGRYTHLVSAPQGPRPECVTSR